MCGIRARLVHPPYRLFAMVTIVEFSSLPFTKEIFHSSKLCIKQVPGTPNERKIKVNNYQTCVGYSEEFVKKQSFFFNGKHSKIIKMY